MLHETLRVIVGNTQRQFTAEMTLPEFDLEGPIEGKLLDVSLADFLSLNFGVESGGKPVTATIRGSRYKFEKLERDGTFVLRGVYAQE